MQDTKKRFAQRTTGLTLVFLFVDNEIEGRIYVHSAGIDIQNAVVFESRGPSSAAEMQAATP